MNITKHEGFVLWERRNLQFYGETSLEGFREKQRWAERAKIRMNWEEKWDSRGFIMIHPRCTHAIVAACVLGAEDLVTGMKCQLVLLCQQLGQNWKIKGNGYTKWQSLLFLSLFIGFSEILIKWWYYWDTPYNLPDCLSRGVASNLQTPTQYNIQHKTTKTRLILLRTFQPLHPHSKSSS